MVRSLKPGLPGLLGGLALLLTSQAPAQAQEQCLTIDEGILVATEISPELMAAQSQIEQAEYQVKGARAQKRPQANGFVRAGYGDGSLLNAQLDNQYGVELSYNLWDFGRTKYNVRSAKAGVEARKASLENTQRQVVKAYFRALIRLRTAREMQTVYQARLDTLKERLEIADRQLENRTITLMEHSRLHSEAALMQLNLTDAKGEETRARLFVQRLLHTDGVCVETAEVPTYLSGNRFVSLEDFIFDMEDDPEYAALKADTEAARLALKSAKREWLPSINASGYVSELYNDFRDDFEYRDRFGIQVSVPLYDGGTRSSEVGRLNSRYRQLDQQLSALESDIRTERNTYWESYEVLSDSLSASEDARLNAETYVNATRRRFDLQAGTVDELLNAEERLVQLQIRSINLESELLNTAIELVRPEVFTVE